VIPLYILGLLQRYGQQHGYQIKKTITEQLADFTQIKLPTIYYHLEKMEASGLLSASSQKEGSRPEKTVYSITEKGIEAFQAKLKNLLEFEYRPSFPLDGVFYFSDYLEVSELDLHLKTYIQKLTVIIASLQNHKSEILRFVPDEMKIMVHIIFSHHERHYQAELDWASESLNRLSLKEETLW
jgi:DNA-binding PadR family transcriptional regulator